MLLLMVILRPNIMIRKNLIFKFLTTSTSNGMLRSNLVHIYEYTRYIFTCIMCKFVNNCTSFSFSSKLYNNVPCALLYIYLSISESLWQTICRWECFLGSYSTERHSTRIDMTLRVGWDGKLGFFDEGNVT